MSKKESSWLWLLCINGHLDSSGSSVLASNRGRELQDSVVLDWVRPLIPLRSRR